MRRWCRTQTSAADTDQIVARLDDLVAENRVIHEAACFNLNPATNVMNPKAQAMLSAGLGSRPSLGYPGDKYEMALEAIEEIEVIVAQLAAEVFQARYAERDVASGAMANLYAFMASCQPGDTIIAPPASIGEHVTHLLAGCAGLCGLKTIEAPVDADGYSVDLAGLRALAQEACPSLITLGASLNLFEHPVAEVRAIAGGVGAKLMFDASHQCGVIAGRVWRNPLADGAHLMTMSTYKSLDGPPLGLIVTNEPDLAQRLDAIAFPGMTANFDAAKSAALAVMPGKAGIRRGLCANDDRAVADVGRGAEIPRGVTQSHQYAIEAANFGGVQTASKTLRKAGFFACGIGLPLPEIPGDLNGLRIGTPELVRWGVTTSDVNPIADLIVEALRTNDMVCLR